MRRTQPGAPRPLILSVGLAVALAGCGWTAPAHDDGDEAFATQAIRAVLGRQPRGVEEVQVLADIAATSGREAVLDALFAEPDYVEYWSNVLADDLAVQRADAMRIDADCTADALLPEHLSDSLATHLATGDVLDPFCVWIEPIPRFPYDIDTIFDKAVQEGLAGHKGETLDSYEPPKPLEPGDLPWWDPDDNKELKSEPSKEVSLHGEGRGRRLLDHDLGYPSKVAEAPDWKRWGELQELHYFKECLPFNLTDVLEASVRADRLDALYRAYLPVMATFPASGDDATAREQLGDLFMEVYFDRDPTCMTCHTATFSRTDPRPLNGNWDRFYPLWTGLPLPLDMEGSVFSYDTGGTFEYRGDGGDAVREQVSAFFRLDNHGGYLQPWGIDDSCVTNSALGLGGYDAGLPADPLGQTASLAGIGPTDQAGVMTLVDELGDGMSTLDSMSLAPIDWASYRAARGATNTGAPSCLSCHTGANAAPDLADRTRVMSDQRLFDIIRNGSGQMPSRASTDSEAWNAVAWVRDTYPQFPALEMQDRSHAFAYFVASTVANHVMEETMGEPLTLGHGFPRNAKQANALADLTSAVADRFSLQDVLREIVLSDAFNRVEPADPSTDPYILPMVPYPQAAIHPASTPGLGDNANSEGDFVHRHSPAGLLQQVHEALGWPRPRVGADDIAYPTVSLMDAIGRYVSTTRTEDPQLALASFVQWESQVATCRKPDTVYSHHVHALEEHDPGTLLQPDEWTDWIDVLFDEGAAQGMSWETLALHIKDRLLAEPDIDATEEELIEALWSEDFADTPPYDASTEDKLRDYCGALLATPDFLLRGTRLAADGLRPPGDPVCLPDEACGADELTERYQQAVEAAAKASDK
jgi:mono/diheme cytochrome c family protein